MSFKFQNRRKLRSFFFKTFLLLILTAIFLPIQTTHAQTSSRYGGQIVLSTTSDPKSFNDIVAKETSTTMVTQLLFEGLTSVDVYTTKVIPNLAKSWEFSEDGLICTFHLRDDVQWHDGVPLTADDVVFTFNSLIYNPDIASSARDIYTIDGQPFDVQKVDDWTVRFVLPTKFAPFLRGMGQAILPKHKLEQAVKQGKFNFTWGIDTDPHEVVGTGAFMFDRYDPGQRLIFKRNPHYWKKSGEGEALPYLDKIIYMIVQNADVQLLKFLEGTTDSYGLRGMDYPMVKPLESKKNFTVYDLGPDTGSQFLFFNQNLGNQPDSQKPIVDPVKLSWFTDLNFRKAAAHAVDRQKIVEIVKNGLGYPQYSPIGPGSGFFHSDEVQKYDYDLDKAREYLKQAGMIDRNGDGIIEDKQGNNVEFNLYTNAGATERVDIAGIIRQDLENLGMKVSFQSLEFNTLVGKLTSSYEWDAIILGLTGGIEPHFGSNVWTSSGQLHMWYPRQEKPATDWERRIDELFSLGVQELNEDKRKVIYDEFQLIVSQNLPLIYTVLSAQNTAVRNRFGNLRPTNYGGVFHNLEEIYVMKAGLEPARTTHASPVDLRKKFK